MSEANQIELLSRITINQNILAGKPVIRGLRISVEQIVKSLASGLMIEDLLLNYPELEKKDIQACLLYATRLIEEEKVYKVD